MMLTMARGEVCMRWHEDKTTEDDAVGNANRESVALSNKVERLSKAKILITFH